MKFSLIFASTISTLFCLTACGGSENTIESSSFRTAIPIEYASAMPTELSVVDQLLGNGESAVAGKRVTVYYTGWLYDPSAANHKGNQFDSNVGRTALTFTLGSGDVIRGFDQGIASMRAGGKRTITIPAKLGYGEAGTANVPANAALIFDVELTNVR